MLKMHRSGLCSFFVSIRKGAYAVYYLSTFVEVASSYPYRCHFVSRKYFNTMPEKSNKLLLLDLDETLIHATPAPLAIAADFQFNLFHIHKRPGLDQFLINISRHFTLGVWSSAGNEYVEEIVKTITPSSIEWFLVWSKNRCTMKRDYVLDTYYFEKKLDKVKNKGFSLEQIIIVDDSPEKSRSNYGNAVYIDPFTGDPNDNELAYLYDYLLTLKDAGNIRAIEKRGWRSQTWPKREISL